MLANVVGDDLSVLRRRWLQGDLAEERFAGAGVLPVRDVAEDEVVRHVAQFAERCNSVIGFDWRE